MDIDKSTFCAASWFQLRTDSTGNFSACCEIDHTNTEFTGTVDFKYPNSSAAAWLNSDYMQYVRQQLSHGNRIKECNNCWQKEKHGEISLRQTSNDTVTKNQGHLIDQSWVKLYLKHKTDYKNDLLMSADISLTNVCNFACSMCNPANSSKIYSHWQQTKDSVWVIHNLSQNPAYLNQVRNAFVNKTNYQLLKFVIDQHTPNIKVLGGEPLLDMKMLKMLASIPDQQKQKTALTIVTNASVSLLDTLEQLGNFGHVHFCVSLEGVGAVQDWVRKGSNWESIKINLEQFCQQMPKSSSVSSQCTVQALTLLHLDPLISWTAQHNIPLRFILLTTPECMSVAAIPENIRSECYTRLTKVNQISSSGNLINMIKDTAVDTSNHSTLKNFLEWYDPDQNWKNIFPEWCEYLS
jgi:molybdenum cofactor biosynthesis enzyme MoaA